MIILNDRKNLLVFSDALVSINIHSAGLKILARYEKQGQQDSIIGEYDDKRKALRAFGRLAAAMKQGDEYFEMPENSDPALTPNLQHDFAFRKVKTTGKTK